MLLAQLFIIFVLLDQSLLGGRRLIGKGIEVPHVRGDLFDRIGIRSHRGADEGQVFCPRG